MLIPYLMICINIPEAWEYLIKDLVLLWVQVTFIPEEQDDHDEDEGESCKESECEQRTKFDRFGLRVAAETHTTQFRLISIKVWYHDLLGIK